MHGQEIGGGLVAHQCPTDPALQQGPLGPRISVMVNGFGRAYKIEGANAGQSGQSAGHQIADGQCRPTLVAPENLSLPPDPGQQTVAQVLQPEAPGLVREALAGRRRGITETRPARSASE